MSKYVEIQDFAYALHMTMIIMVDKVDHWLRRSTKQYVHFLYVFDSAYIILILLTPARSHIARVWG